MIPYFEFTVIPLGPISIQIWGLFVSSGILAGLLFGKYLIKKNSLSVDLIFNATLWALIGAFICARLFHVLFYDLGFYIQNPIEIIKLWHGGASSLGGFFGAFLGIIFFLKKKHVSFQVFLPYLDLGILGLWLGWGIGRIGCFLIHDHPGTLSNFLLAVKYPNGSRHDLGLYDSLLGFFIFTLFFILYKRNVFKEESGKLATYSVVFYSIVRFLFDFLRVIDVRYFFLTPAQWGMLIVVIVLISVQFRASLKNKT